MTEVIELTSNDLVPFNGEPRVLDVRLGEVLGFGRPRDIRQLIDRHVEALGRFGEVCSTVEQTSANLRHGAAKSDSLGVLRRGRPAMAYHLNQKQAIYICTKSETPAATEITIRIVEVFDAWLKGEVVHSDLPEISIIPRRGRLTMRNEDIRTQLAIIQTAEKLMGREAGLYYWERSGLPKIPKRLVLESYGGAEDDGIGALRHLFRYAVGGGLTVRHLYRAAQHDDLARGRLLRMGIRIVLQGQPDHAAVAGDHPFLAEVFAPTQWADQWHMALALLAQARPAKNTVTFDKKRRATLVPLATLDAIA